MKHLLIHTSAILYKNTAILFLGPNQGGKSTTARNAVNSKISLHCDDLGELIISETHIKIQDYLKKNKAGNFYPIVCGFILKKSNSIECEEIPKLKRYIYMSRAVFECPLNRRKSIDERKKMFQIATKIARRIPLYTLKLQKNSRFVTKILEIVDKILSLDRPQSDAKIIESR